MTLARALTPEGVDYARTLLDDIRQQRPAQIELPDELLFESPYSAPLHGVDIDVEARSFANRRIAGNYLSLLLQAARPNLAEEYGLWSWLGMYYLPLNHQTRNAGAVLLGRDEVYVLHGADEHVKRRRYVHYLWSAWQLQRQHPHAQFLLDTRLWDYRDIVDRVFSSQRIFNSEGVVELVLLLYTQDGKQKPKFGRSRGGLRHLIRVLEQLERTYDVYGMETEALLRILPADFDRWRPDRSPAVPATPERVARRPWERFHIGIRSRGNRSQNPE